MHSTLKHVNYSVICRPVNPTDLINARGLWPWLKGTTPYTGGSEGGPYYAQSAVLAATLLG